MDGWCGEAVVVSGIDLCARGRWVWNRSSRPEVGAVILFWSVDTLEMVMATVRLYHYAVA